MHHDELQADRWLGEAWELHTHHRPALRTSTRQWEGGLVDRKASPLMSEAKQRHLRRVPVHTSAAGEAAVSRPLHVPVLTPLSLAAVDSDFDPGRAGEVSQERRVRV
jgi:hypothetical protein